MQQFPFLIPRCYFEPDPGAAPFPVIHDFSSMTSQNRGCQLVGQLFVIDNFNPGTPVPGTSRI